MKLGVWYPATPGNIPRSKIGHWEEFALVYLCAKCVGFLMGML